MQIMRQAAFVRWSGASRSWVNQQIKKGVLQIKKGEHGEVSVIFPTCWVNLRNSSSWPLPKILRNQMTNYDGRGDT